MMKNTIQKIVAISFLACLLACAPQGNGDKFLGKWVGIQRHDHIVEITKNGTNYLITEYHPNCGWTGKDGTYECKQVKAAPMTAQYKQGLLTVVGPFGSMTLDIVAATGNLTAMGEEFSRTK